MGVEVEEGGGIYSLAWVLFLLRGEPSRSQLGQEGEASCSHLRSSTSRMQRSTAGRDGVRPVPPPHSMEFSWGTNAVIKGIKTQSAESQKLQ